MANAKKCPKCGGELIQCYPKSVYPSVSINLRSKFECIKCDEVTEIDFRKCQAINKNGKQCSKNSVIGEYCMTHHCYLHNIKSKKTNKDEGIIELGEK